MAYDYNKAKEQYEKLNDEQKQQFANDNSWNVQQFLKQYNQEKNTATPTSNESNFNNQNETNWQNSTNNQSNTRQLKWDNLNSNLTTEYVDNNGGWRSMNYDDRKKEYEKMDEAGKKWYSNFLNSQSDDYWGRWFMDTYSEENGLDTSKFNQAPWQITVKEWTAAQTGKPDYTISTDARLNEMKGNLDQYFKDSPRMFSDRETFNKVFDYNGRESEAQRQLLDSYWKRKEDMDKASTYTSWEAINNWMKNWEITTDQLNLLKEYNPEAYQKWQQLQEDEIMKRIVNDIVPKTVEEISWKINSMIEALGIQAQDALDIEWIYNDTMAKVGAYQTMEDANRTVKELEAAIDKKNSIMNRYASSTWWTVSDALAAARMQKAIAPYNEQIQWLQYQYQDYYNLYSQKSATAMQAANVRAMQAQENQRIWNQKCSALGFATSALSYRTPEEQAQLQLQTQQAQNEMQLLQQSRLNDLNRYNTYATTKMQNQLQAELTDLSVEDEQQLKANLNNVLSDYYKNYWDIIQRSQAQVVDDVIAYAKKNWISVAQALTDNFIKPLQNKAEYKQKVATDYGMLSKQSITTINWRSVIMTTNPNGSISYQYIDSWITDSYTIDGVDYVVYNWKQMTAKEFNEKYWNKVWTVKPYDMVDSKVFENNPYENRSYYTLWEFVNDPRNQEGQEWGQCASFVNDYLEKIGVGRYFGTEDIKTRESRCNSDTAKVWTIAVFDYNHYIDWKNYGHVWIVVDTDENGFRVLDSNYDTKNPWKIAKRYIRYGSSSCKGFFDPSQPPRTTTNTSSEIDKIKAEAMIKQIKTWSMTPSETSEARDRLLKHGYGAEFNEALDKWRKMNLTDAQIKWMDKTDASFSSNSIVKEFEDAANQIQQLAVALDDASWVWDMSAIFTFMKTLDPSSVVRESEFNSAAATAWVLNPSAIWQSLEKNVDWRFLTQKQREDFKKIAREFIKIKANNYQVKYNDLLKRYEYYDIDPELAPTNMAQVILEALDTPNASWPDNQLYDIYSSAMNNTTYSSGDWYNNMSYGGYDTSFLDYMINNKL